MHLQKQRYKHEVTISSN